MIRIIAIGKKHEEWVKLGLERYQKRLKQPWQLEWRLLPHSSLQGTQARQEESTRISASLNDTDYVILLDEIGEQLTSPKLSKRLESLFANSTQVVIVIGGAYGVTSSLLVRANFVCSLSELVFPHQLVRLLLVEQLYRAQSIANGTPYHHE